MAQKKQNTMHPQLQLHPALKKPTVQRTHTALLPWCYGEAMNCYGDLKMLCSALGLCWAWVWKLGTD